MGGGGDQVELRRIGRVVGVEGDLRGAHADIEHGAPGKRDVAAVAGDAARAADIAEAKLAAGEEGRLADGLVGAEGERTADGHRAADHQPVDVAVGQFDRIGREQALDEKFRTQPRGVELAGGVGVRGVPDGEGHGGIWRVADSLSGRCRERGRAVLGAAAAAFQSAARLG